MAVHDLIKKNVTEHQRIVFNGNGYSDGWVEEAERRGLPNIRSMVDAIPYLATDKSVALFERFGVFTRAELESRVEVEYETYAKTINIEAKAMMNIAENRLFRQSSNMQPHLQPPLMQLLLHVEQMSAFRQSC